MINFAQAGRFIVPA